MEATTMTAKEAALLLGVSHDTVARLYRKGVLAGFKQAAGKNSPLKLYRQSVELWDRTRRNAHQGAI